MTNDPSNASLRFFGKVSASISHEIKNVMAIINEKAGLLKDLTLMAQKGMALDIFRVQAIADDLRAQIKRGDAIVKNMNKFAHSVDYEIAEVNLTEMTGLVVALAERLAAKHGVTLMPPPPQPALVIRTRPFLLEQFIWQCLEQTMENRSGDTVVYVELEKSNHHVVIYLKMRHALESSNFKSLSWLLAALNADLSIMDNNAGLMLTFPKDLAI